MPIAQVQDLRRIAEAVAQLRGLSVEDVEIRADCRLFRITLSDGRMLLVSAMVDELGKPRLDVDFLHAPEQTPHRQLEVPFNVPEQSE